MAHYDNSATSSPYLRHLAEGTWVYCDFVKQEARTADGFCQYCGSTSHRRTEK